MSAFKREARYVVVKLKDIVACGATQAEIDAFNAFCDKVSQYRLGVGKPLLECVVVENDWPEYESTWKAIEARQSDRPTSCPHAHPFMYCEFCKVLPCPFGLDK